MFTLIILIFRSEMRRQTELGWPRGVDCLLSPEVFWQEIPGDSVGAGSPLKCPDHSEREGQNTSNTAALAPTQIQEPQTLFFHRTRTDLPRI